MANQTQNQKKQNQNQQRQNRNAGGDGQPVPNGVQDQEEFRLRETAPVLGGGRVCGSERLGTAFDLVEQMQFLYVRVVKAKELEGNEDHSPHPFVEVRIGNFRELTRHFEKKSDPEWNQVFTVLKERIQSTVIEVAVRDKDKSEGDDLIGMAAFDVSEVPTRVPPDSPLAPQWYRLESKIGEKKKVKGELMLAVWIGTQADEAFPEAWHMDATSVSGENVANIKSKVYLSPRLWYLRVNVIEAQELQAGDNNRHHPDFFVRASLGGVALRTKISISKNTSPSWNEDLMFVVAEPFEEELVLTVEDKVAANKEEVLGKCLVSLQTVEKRMDFKAPISRWYGLEKHAVGENGEINVIQLNSKLHLRLSFDGGYHVLDELTQYSSDFKATARQLSKPPIGVLELGILSAQDLTSMKNRDGHGTGTTDAYCVAKYGQKWIRTRTILSSFNPKWNEQYTWEVFDPCTVITIGVFDNQHLRGTGKSGDHRIGKVRIRLSTLETDRVYTHSYPLIVLSPSGVKKMGEIQLAVRFSCASLYNMLSAYSKPLLPILHYLHPLTSYQVENLRHQATHIVSMRMSRAEPPLRKEVVEYMLDVGSNMWSVRRSKANYLRIGAILSSIASVCILFNRVCSWRNPVITVLVHFLFLMCVCFPEFILSFVFLYMFMIGVYKYRTRPKHPPHMNISLSQADRVHPDELDEEFDTFPTSKSADAVKMRYDRLRSIGSRLQMLAGDMATQGERLASLLSWRDPRATALFLIVCLFASILFYIVPFKILFLALGFYMMRHPRFREKLPSAVISFYRRLPAKSDSLL